MKLESWGFGGRDQPFGAAVFRRGGVRPCMHRQGSPSVLNAGDAPSP
jgi:hypothetical protein